MSEIPKIATLLVAGNRTSRWTRASLRNPPWGGAGSTCPRRWRPLAPPTRILFRQASLTPGQAPHLCEVTYVAKSTLLEGRRQATGAKTLVIQVTWPHGGSFTRVRPLSELFQFQGIASGVSCLVIVEINEHSAQTAAPVRNAFRPGTERIAAVAALILPSRTVQTDVSKIGGDFRRRLKTFQVVNAKCSVMATQDLVNLRHVPARVAKLEGVAQFARQDGEQRLQALGIRRPAWRELEQDRSQFLLQPDRARQEVIESVLWVFQLFVMGEKAACLDSEAEPRRSGIAPLAKAFRCREAIEAVVDLDSIKALQVKIQHLRRGQAFRVERTAPMLVLPSRGADTNRAGHAVGCRKRWQSAQRPAHHSADRFRSQAVHKMGRQGLQVRRDWVFARTLR